MNTGQSFLSMGAMVLVSLVILRMNNTFSATNSVLVNDKITILAVSLASSILEEASGKAFDELSINNAVNDVDSLTPVYGLGKESGENIGNFDDFDDYNNYHLTDANLPSGKFSVNCQVYYVDPSNPDVRSIKRTWHKKISVFVTSPSLLNEKGQQDTIKMTSVFSYWHFR